MSLLLALKMDETTGYVASDASGNDHHCESQDIADLNFDDCATTGKFGGALLFPSGTDNYLLGPNDNTFDFSGAADDFTVSFWFKPLDFANVRGICGTAALYNTATDGWYILLTGTGAIRAFTGNAYSTYTISGLPADIADADWYHIVIEYNGTTDAFALWINGVSTNWGATVGTHANPASGERLMVGASTGDRVSTTYTWKSALDDLRIYDALLDQYKINALYNGPYGTSLNNEAALELLAKLDETDVSDTATIADSSIYERDGAVSGTTLASVVGKYGKAIDFSGGSGEIEMPDNTDFAFSSGDFSVAFWAKLYNGASGGAVMGTSTDWANNGWGIRQSDIPQLRMYTSDGTYSNSYIAVGAYVGAWHHFAWTFDSTGPTGQWYVDGAAVSTTGTARQPASGGRLVIGSVGSDSSYTSKHVVDDVRIYSRVLSTGDVAAVQHPYSNVNLLDPSLLKPGLTTPDGTDLKPSLVTSNYSSGTPSSADEIKAGLLDGDDLNATMVDGDGALKPSLLK